MASFRLPRLPDRQAIQYFISTMQPRAGRIVGALSGMILAGPAWLYGLCVGILLGYMVDTVRAKAASGSSDTATGSTNTASGSTNTASGSGEAGTGGSPEDAENRDVEANAYQCLGLRPGASMAEVKKAWRVRSRQAHPDAPGGAAEDFMTLKSAYEKIMEQLKDNPAGH